MMLLAQQEYKMFSEADVSYIIRTIINEVLDVVLDVVLDWNDTTADMRLSPWHTPIWWRNNAIVGGLWDMIWL